MHPAPPDRAPAMCKSGHDSLRSRRGVQIPGQTRRACQQVTGHAETHVGLRWSGLETILRTTQGGNDPRACGAPTSRHRRIALPIGLDARGTKHQACNQACPCLCTYNVHGHVNGHGHGHGHMDMDMVMDMAWCNVHVSCVFLKLSCRFALPFRVCVSTMHYRYFRVRLRYQTYGH